MTSKQVKLFYFLLGVAAMALVHAVLLARIAEALSK